MELTKKILDAGELYGFLVEDGEEKFPILKEALWCEVIANSLLESGYKLLGLPYDFVQPDGTSIQELEAVELKDLALTEMQKVEMKDMLVTRMKKATMMTLVSDNGKVGGHTFKKLKVILKTREELLKHLRERSLEKKNSTKLTDIIPINAITADSALLSPEEYVSTDSVELRGLIHEYANLTFEQYKALVDVFKDLGLPENFDAKDFIDIYLSFGVPGMHVENASIKTEESPMIFGAKYKYQDTWKDDNDSLLPYLRDTVCTYMDANGDIHKTVKTSTGNWKMIHSNRKKSKIIELNSLGMEYITPVEIEARVTEKVTSIVNEAVGIIYNDTFMEITVAGNRKVTDTIVNIAEPGTKNKLETRFYNSSEGELEEHLECSALAQALIERITVKANVSTYRALQAIGASPLSACQYYINREDTAEYWSLNHIDSNNETEIIYKNLDAEAQMAVSKQVMFGNTAAAALGKYLRGEMTEHNDFYLTAEHIISSLLSGGLNVDGVNQGKALDGQTSARNTYYDYIYIARKYMNMSARDIYNLLTDVDEKTPRIVFEGNGMKMVMKLTPIKYAVDMFQQDVENYKMRQVDQAKVLGHVTKLYTEYAANRIPGKHVAIEYKMLNLKSKKIADAVNPIIDKLVIMYQEVIAGNYRQTDPLFKKLNAYARKDVIENLFRLIAKGKICISKLFFGITPVKGEVSYVEIDCNSDEVPHPLENINEFFNGNSMIKVLRTVVETAVSSTTLLADNTITYMGDFRTYFDNAVVTPEYVVPNPGFKIPEINIRSAWMKFLPEVKEQMIALYEQGNILPKEEIDSMKKGSYASLETRYKRCHYPMGSEQSVDTFRGNLITYSKNADIEIKAASANGDVFCRPQHPLLHTYPVLNKILDIAEEKEVAGEKNAKGQYVYKLPACALVSREDIFARNPELAALGKIETKNIQLENKYCIKTFEGLPIEAFLENDNVFELMKKIDDGKALIFSSEANNDLVFGKDDIVDIKDIEEAYKSGKYKIRKVSARSYLVQTFRGTFVEVEIL